MAVHEELQTGGVPVKIFTDDIDRNSRLQLAEVARLPIVRGHIAAMPDVHLGIGATVGSVIPTRRALIPAAVGVDIGCGMAAQRLTLTADQLPDNLKKVREAIEQHIPVGRAGHETAVDSHAPEGLASGLKRILERHPDITKMIRNAKAKCELQRGSLGGGNHFLELTIDQDDGVWFMLHSGSRGIGNAIGRYFTSLARKDMERLDSQLPENKDLCYFKEGSDHFDDYFDALDWAQSYALENRRAMVRLMIKALRETLPAFELAQAAVQCHHNYVALETHFGQPLYVTRKGAIRARTGDLGIIPGSMGARSYIVRGKGHADALCSAPHGAGRRMSRSKAKRTFTVEDLAAQTTGVECRKDAGVIDEAPGAYKPIEQVMADASDLVSVVATLKQVVCVKG